MTERKRPYRSEVRQRQAERTRVAIVDAAIRLLTADRLPPISVPEIAAEAELGVATVYRHFGSKEGVLHAVYDRWMASAREVLADRPQKDLETFLAVLPQLWRRQSENERLADAMSSYSAAGKRVRRQRLDRRRTVARDLLASTDLTDEAKKRLEPIILLLTSTTAHKHLRDHWDLGTSEAADLVAMAIRTLVGSGKDR